MRRLHIEEELKTAFKKHRVLDMQALQKIAGNSSSRTVYRYLKPMNHLTSYTHNGKYYTLPEIVQFDERGFWFYGDVGFSKYGTLIDTVRHLITSSGTGQTNSDLEKQCRVRIQEMLRTLLSRGEIARLKQEGYYLYLSADQKVNAKQQDLWKRKRVKKPLKAEVIIEVAIETILSLPGPPDITVVTKRLAKRGSSITHEEVEQVFEHLGLEKKTLH